MALIPMAVLTRVARGQKYDATMRRWIGKQEQEFSRWMKRMVLNMETGLSWGEIAMQEEDKQDARFLAMTDEEYLNFLLHTEEGIHMSGDQLLHINLKRMRAPKNKELVEDNDVKTCAYWYNEYTRFPQLYFANEAEQKEEIAKVVAEWRTSVGRWRLGKMEDAAKTIQGAWASWKDNRCRDCGVARATIIEHETPVCEACLNEPEFCKVCRIREATCPGTYCVKCSL
jgi:hypothetical protein